MGILKSVSVLSVCPVDLYSSSCTLTHTHTHTHLVGLLSVSDQAITEATTYTTHNRQKGKISVHQRYLNKQYQQSEATALHALGLMATRIGL